MKTYYQVSASFQLSSGKPNLVKLSFNSSFDYFPYLIISNKSSNSFSKFFRSKTEAGNYINYLFSRYPESSARRPVLDESQFLFSFGS